MWGLIFLESSTQNIFSTGFSSIKSDILISLAQWQYWWWFWFAFVWSLYLLLINKIACQKVLKIKPNVNTSIRGHGKWGDFLAAILPSIWCLNILINSNFLLRLIEWQTESSLFIIRIRGRQWYWIYKFDAKSIFDLYNAPKNIGHNNWFIIINNKMISSKNYSYLIYLKTITTTHKNYWIENLKKTNFNYLKTTKLNVSTINNIVPQTTLLTTELKQTTLITNFFKNNLLGSSTIQLKDSSNFLKLFFYNSAQNFNNKNNLFLSYLTQKNKSSLTTGEVILKNRQQKKMLSANSIQNVSKFNNDISIINTQNTKKHIISKSNYNAYLVLKQKRYTRKKIIAPLIYTIKEKANILKIKYNVALNKNNQLESQKLNVSDFYKLLKKNKARAEGLSVTFSRRLLRTKKTLVLPIHVNITAVTNSYDVIHSWFVPSLGLKMDCVPGRSTHHTFFIENPGFYYGQCAEVCGRYHHHMPIRVCALPYDHFIFWWNTFGITKFFSNFKNTQSKIEFANKKFVW